MSVVMGLVGFIGMLLFISALTRVSYAALEKHMDRHAPPARHPGLDKRSRCHHGRAVPVESHGRHVADWCPRCETTFYDEAWIRS